MPKYTTPHLTPLSLLEILASSLTNIFSDQITSVSKACYCHIRQLRCIRPYLDSSTACTIAIPLLFTPSLITVADKLPKSQLSRLQQIQNSCWYYR